MDTLRGQECDRPSDESRRDPPGELAWLTPKDQALRARIIDHCAWISTFNRAEAVSIFNHYHHELPWLKLKSK